MSSPDSEATDGLPTDLQEWVHAEAERQGLESEEFLQRLLAAHQAAMENEELTETTLDEATLDTRIEDVREEFMDLLKDVRKRVVQVKQETDDKAPADHEHPELNKELKQVTTAVTELETTIEDHQRRMESLEGDLESGFENYKDILEHLLETVETIESRMDTLGRATLDAREQLRNVVGEHRRREILEELKQSANEQGINGAQCDACGAKVQIGLLTEPQCPHCSSNFTEVDGTTGVKGLFKRNKLRTGDQPALTGRQRPKIDETIEEEIEADHNSADVSWGRIGEEDEHEQ